MQSSLQSYDCLKSHQLNTYTIIKWHFSSIIKSVNRKLTLKRKFKDPFTCTISIIIHKEIFYQAFRAVRDYYIRTGQETEIKKNKQGKITGYSLKFIHFGVFKYHLEQLSGIGNIYSDLFKNFPSGSVAKVVVSPEKPASFDFRCSSDTLNIKIHYNVTNKYGNVTSF